MTINLASRQETLDELLGLSFAAIDIPAGVRARAISRYREVANWLSAYWTGGAAGEVYPQGSFRLGTVVSPIHADGEYDLDLVCRIDVQSTSLSQEELKRRVGVALRAYVNTSPVGLPRLEEGARCWTLVYPGEPFHMDVLPAIPDSDGREHAIKLTDRDLRKWQSSNPIAYAEWFREVMVEEIRVLKEAAAATRGLGIQAVPDDEVTTTLQRAVQALKRHRDIYFGEEMKLAPASIIITTLAARSYAGVGSLYEVLMNVTEQMPSQVELVGGRYVIENPVCEDENFADRWHRHPEKADAFFSWMRHAAADFGALRHAEGTDVLLEGVRKSFGDGPALAAEAEIGSQIRNRRSNGLLTVGGVGTLGAVGRRTVPDHEFHGDASPA